ncbi:hypothetical protein DY000_02038313 [Brassica cretica]|uniref:Uncharacterized protein n=1 Tax=Brassica cretica TaxID=69181 RepID=A0ABQ7BBV6_BRACR|nr:hypothetical protein DY000_02038313 [Brassica cretica]
MASCDTTIGPLLHRQARCLTSASTVFSVPTHGDVYLGAVPVPETFRGRVLHGNSTGTAWGRLENIAMKSSFRSIFFLPLASFHWIVHHLVIISIAHPVSVALHSDCVRLFAIVLIVFVYGFVPLDPVIVRVDNLLWNGGYLRLIFFQSMLIVFPPAEFVAELIVRRSSFALDFCGFVPLVFALVRFRSELISFIRQRICFFKVIHHHHFLSSLISSKTGFKTAYTSKLVQACSLAKSSISTLLSEDNSKIKCEFSYGYLPRPPESHPTIIQGELWLGHFRQNHTCGDDVHGLDLTAIFVIYVTDLPALVCLMLLRKRYAMSLFYYSSAVAGSAPHHLLENVQATSWSSSFACVLLIQLRFTLFSFLGGDEHFVESSFRSIFFHLLASFHWIVHHLVIISIAHPVSIAFHSDCVHLFVIVLIVFVCGFVPLDLVIVRVDNFFWIRGYLRLIFFRSVLIVFPPTEFVAELIVRWSSFALEFCGFVPLVFAFVRFRSELIVYSFDQS